MKVLEKRVKDSTLRRAGFQIAERIPGKEPVWKKRRKGKWRLYRQSEAEAIVEGRR